jgi:hypothetical protein
MYLLSGHFYISPNISVIVSFRVPGKGAPSIFPNRVLMGSDTLSPVPMVYHSFIHSCMSAGDPKKEPSCIWGKT